MYVLILNFFFVSIAYSHSFEELALKRWSAAVEVNLAQGLKQNISIKEPKDTVLEILNVTLLREGKTLSTDCLFYKTPSSKGSGELYIVPLTQFNDKCRDHILDTPLVRKTGIFNFGISLDSNLSLLVDDQKTKIGTNIDSRNLYAVLAGKSNFKLKENDICFDVDFECKVIQSDLCDFCPAGYSRVITDKCPGIYRKYCRQNSCGARGEAACIRGFKSTGLKENICINDSPVGFCRGDLRVFCKNNELICL